MDDIHPHPSCCVIFIVLLLSESYGSLGSFRLVNDVIISMFVSLLPSMVFSRGMGDPISLFRVNIPDVSDGLSNFSFSVLGLNTVRS